MKIIARVRRREDGTFQAMIQQIAGTILWKCDHKHPYGTSNRSKQDSASKCGHAQLKVMRNGQG